MSALYLDDLRTPPKNRKWSYVARTSGQAWDYMLAHGCVLYIAFDHDLGPGEPTGYDLAKMMVERDLDKGGTFIPKDFRFHVHSANPVGAANIQSLLDSYLAHRRNER